MPPVFPSRQDTVIDDVDDSWQARSASARARLAEAGPDGAPPFDPADLVGVLEHLCLVVREHHDVDGVTLSLMTARQPAGVAATTDDRSRRLTDLQFASGEGPCLDAHRQRRPVLVPDLSAADAVRWPGYTSLAWEVGLAAVFAFPLNVGAAGLGVLELLVDTAGLLPRRQLDSALVYSRIATEILLDGRLMRTSDQLDPAVSAALAYRAEIYQAQGMLTVLLDVEPAEALTRMRAHAFSHGQPLLDLAKDIVAGRGFAADEI